MMQLTTSAFSTGSSRLGGRGVVDFEREGKVVNPILVTVYMHISRVPLDKGITVESGSTMTHRCCRLRGTTTIQKCSLARV